MTEDERPLTVGDLREMIDNEDFPVPNETELRTTRRENGRPAYVLSFIRANGNFMMVTEETGEA